MLNSAHGGFGQPRGSVYGFSQHINTIHEERSVDMEAPDGSETAEAYSALLQVQAESSQLLSPKANAKAAHAVQNRAPLSRLVWPVTGLALRFLWAGILMLYSVMCRSRSHSEEMAASRTNTTAARVI